MRLQYVVAASMLGGAAICALSVGGLKAQGDTPGAYAILQFTELGQRAAFNANVAVPFPLVTRAYGGRIIARSDDVAVLRVEDPPLTRYVIIGFDNVERAKAWWASDQWKPMRNYLEQHTKGRAFVVRAAKQ